MLSYLPREVDFVIDLNGIAEKNISLSPTENEVLHTAENGIDFNPTTGVIKDKKTKQRLN